jgi:hypothetical protein
MSDNDRLRTVSKGLYENRQNEFCTRQEIRTPVSYMAAAILESEHRQEGA